ncbi:50S ribosomal protein L23 [Geodia barretti]|jgi:large subunit ribosomal protein L23|uniref:Large ribosomal subunit protein uL23c n=1 Tax=Geodia barretti TaxID=519541 RepID=A0AA35RIN4_GEOBA|nr:50S ribosomal protein L23 [Geodia barretti]
MHISEVLLRPTITEKSTLLQEVGQYTFVIAPRANKTMVKQAVQENFNVTVLSVNITRNHGKRKRYGPRYKKQPDVKKAVVTLQAGDRIELIEGL